MKPLIQHFIRNGYFVCIAIFVAFIVGAFYITDADETRQRNWIVAFFCLCIAVVFIAGYFSYKRYEKTLKK